MNFRTLLTFVEVARQGGFSSAAKVVFATQSTVSKAVQALEEELGTQLLNRIGHRSELTVAGEIVYRHALTIIAQRDDMIVELDDLRDLKRGKLRLGLPPVGSDILFAPLFATFRSRYPGIEVHLVEHGGSQLRDSLATGEVEVAALLTLFTSDFECQDVRIEPLMVIMPSDLPLAREKSINMGSLAGLPFILFQETFAMNPLIQNACERCGFKPNIVARSAQIDFIVELVAAGMGIAFLPRMIAEQHQHPAIRRVLLDEPGTAWHMTLAWRREAYLSQAARAWLALARETYGAEAE